LANQNLSSNKKGVWRGFPLQLLLLTILPLTILLLIVAFGSQTLHHEAMRSLVGDRDLRAVRATAGSIELEIMHRSTTLQMLARSMGGQNDLNNLLLTPDELAANFDGGMAILAADGKLLHASSQIISWAQINTTLPGYLQKVMASKNDPVFSSPFQVAGKNTNFILVGTPLSGQNILIGAFSPRSLLGNRLSNSIGSGQTSAMIIAPAAAGTAFEILYHAGPERSDEVMSSHPGIQESFNGDSGINYYHIAGEEHVVAFCPIYPPGWGLVTEEAWEDISSPYLNTTQSAPLIIVPLFLLSLLALWFGIRRIVQPLQALEKQASQLAEGDFKSIHQPVGGIEEIRNLQNELIEMADKLKAAQQSLHYYIGAMTDSVENERRSLARELHDDTIQSLIALKQRLQLISMNAARSHNSGISELQALIDQSITNLRRVIRGLRPIYLEDLGLVASLKVLAQDMQQNAAPLTISFSTQGEEQDLTSFVEMTLYRMVQDSLNNIIHHAAARHARVVVELGPSDFTLRIEDDGKGFDTSIPPAKLAGQGHFGLLGLHERAKLIDAELTIQSTPGQGTTITIHKTNLTGLTADD
jgi:signal transduction histidine kinase